MNKLSAYDWYCDACNSFLNEQPGFDANCGYWMCTECCHSNKIDESEIISDSEINRFDYFGETENIPEGCAACGGPYPHCKDSCPLFGN